VPGWYARTVFFTSDLDRSLRFYHSLGFKKIWHEGDGEGKVCQVGRAGCEIILCEDVGRRDRGRLFIELDPNGMAELKREAIERAIPCKASWWGYDCLQIDDPDGNEMYFPYPAG